MGTFKIYCLSKLFKMQYSIINYSNHAIHYIFMTYLFYNLEFVPFDNFHPFLPSPTPYLCQPPICFLYQWACFIFVYLFCFLILHTSKIIHTLFVFLWFFSLSIISSRCIYVVAMARFYSFPGWIIFHYIYAVFYMSYIIYITLSLSIHPLMHT